jgi:hypothetical protein
VRLAIVGLWFPAGQVIWHRFLNVIPLFWGEPVSDWRRRA